MFCGLAGTLKAQNELIDSLENRLITTHTSMERIEIFTLLSKRYQQIDLEKARDFAVEALLLSDNTGIDDFRAELFGCLGDIAVMHDSLDLAIKHYETSLELFKKDHDDAGLAGVCLVLGNIALVQNQLVDALDYYQSAIRYSEAAGFDEWLDNLYSNIGNINREAGNHMEAQGLYATALEKAIEQGDSMMMVIAYSNLGLTSIALQDTVRARDYLNRSQELAFKLRLNSQIAHNYHSLSRLEYYQGNYHNANALMDKALLALNVKDQNYAGPKGILMAEFFNQYGNNYRAMEEPDSAAYFYRKAMSLAKSNSQLEIIANAARGLSGIYENRGLLDSSLYYFKTFKAFADSILNEENIKKLAYRDALFRFEEKAIREKQEREKQAIRENQRVTIMIAIIAILFLVLIALILLLKLGRNRMKRIELEQVNLIRELEARNKELTTHVLYQLKKNEFILNITGKLKETVKRLKPENKRTIESVIRELDKDTGDELWKEFEIRFQQVHIDFYKKLVEKFPDLTTNDLRLSAFLKLNMSTKDIAAITYQSVNSIDVARSRLRQKFGLSKEENLSAFLSRF
ncbi:MAG: tetratricopeptide repeat protein [bacterium]